MEALTGNETVAVDRIRVARAVLDHLVIDPEATDPRVVALAREELHAAEAALIDTVNPWRAPRQRHC